METGIKNIEGINTNIDFQSKMSVIEYDSLGKWEKNYIQEIAKLLNVLKTSEFLDLNSFKKTLDLIQVNRMESEKQYLYGLFFPEKINKLYYFTPLPFQGTIYTQKNKFNLSPSQNGYFLLQVKTPLMTNASSNYSDVYYCNNSKIGVTYDETQYANEPSPTVGAADFLSIKQTSIPTELFSGFIVLATTVKVSYVGNLRDQSGIFSGSYMLSSVDHKLPDKTAVNFDYITRGLNYVECSTLDPLHATYFPMDNSFFEFKTPLGQEAFNSQQTMHVINITGRGLPYLLNSVFVEITRAFACIPSPKYNSAFKPSESVKIDFNRVKELIVDKNVAMITGEEKIKRLSNIETYPRDIESLKDDFYTELGKNSQINLIKLK